ncbi:hypothetical protein KHA96_05470 [Bacillus sp. FJAT-49711]|uniref:hypothetical protein n=1 Tax=Bacillus sp. FJAT-49711 TaxID=2833585 RepID=UPI001BC9B4E6|nr:hypothetical protein [Bacillus sp. FJAT-49711]MBS4217767.1 hypothetical protein [Bacillus sp. FJAT-49711]
MNDLLQNQETLPRNSLQFRFGQIFYGTVQKLFPNQHAEIKLGAHKIIAKLEVPLSTGKGYWLQVNSNDGAPKLKLLNPSTQYGIAEKNSSAKILHHLGLQNEKVNQSLINHIMNHSFSLTKEEIIRASQLLNQSNNHEEGLQIIKLMSQKNLPFNEGIFKSLLAAGSSESTTQLVKALHASLLTEQGLNDSGKDLLRLLQSLESDHVESLLNRREDTLNHLKQSIHRTGIFYENTILDREINNALMKDSIKPLLVAYLQEHSQSIQSDAKNIAEQLLFRMNGFQLISSENGPVHHLLFEIPIKLGSYQSEIVMQWSGKRSDDGKINSDFCRIIFYLDLEHLKETMVDMQIQNRIVTVNILNSSNELQKLSVGLLPAVTAGLKELGYHLSSLHFKLPEDLKKQNVNRHNYHSNQSYTGVDIRI